MRWIITFLRYTSVLLITLFLCVVIYDMRYHAGYVYIIIYFSIIFFPVTILMSGFWIYSLILSLRGHTDVEAILLSVHILDIVLLILILLQRLYE